MTQIRKAQVSGLQSDLDTLTSGLTGKQNTLGFTPENSANKNTNNGYAGLDSSGKVAAAQLPSYVDDVLEFANLAALPGTGETGKIYVTLDTNKEYRWSGSTYIQIVASPGTTDAVAEGSTNLYFTAARVVATVLTGIGFSTSTAVLATDTILQAFGKLQAQITALFKIPTGGTTGQIFAKIDDTNGNTHWIDAPTGGGGSVTYTSRTFDEILTFDVNFKMSTTQTADIAFVLGSSPVEDVSAHILITGDGTHACTFPSDWVSANGNSFDNTQDNLIFLDFIEGKVWYSLLKTTAPDVTAPTLVTATIENAFKNKIVLTYSELLAAITPATGDFVINIANVISSIVVAGSTVTIVCADNFLNTDVVTVTYTPGTNKIQDPSGNLAASFTTHSVVNNVAPVNLSLSVLATNEIPKSALNPASLAFGTGGGSGSDTPMSISFWVKFVSASPLYINLQRQSTTASCGIFMYGGGGNLTTQIMGAGGLNSEAISISIHTALPTSIWHHIVLTYSGNKLNTGLKMYANGSLITTDNSNIGTYNGQVSFSSNHQLAIGGGVVSGTDLPSIGDFMDEVFFWNIELSSSQVSALYNAGSIIDPSTLAYASNLVAGYKFDGDLTDIGPHSYDLTSTASPTFSTDAP